MYAPWQNGGKSLPIRCAVLWERLAGSTQKRAATFGSYLGGVLEPNNGGFLVRDDRPRLTTAVPTVAVPRPGSTSH